MSTKGGVQPDGPPCIHFAGARTRTAASGAGRASCRTWRRPTPPSTPSPSSTTPPPSTSWTSRRSPGGSARSGGQTAGKTTTTSYSIFSVNIGPHFQRGLPYMMFAPKGAGHQKIPQICGQTPYTVRSPLSRDIL